MKVKVYNKDAKETGTMELPDSVFGQKWNADLVYQVVQALAANERPTVAHAKGRGEVRGGGKKPWKQKGTGRARHGSIRSPIWKGGGAAHGPKKERSYKKKINRKMAHAALRAVLSAKAKENEIFIMDDLHFSAPKTRLAAEIFKKISQLKEFSNITKGNGVLVALPGNDGTAKKALRNLPFAGVSEARNLNAREILQYKFLMFPKETVKFFEKK